MTLSPLLRLFDRLERVFDSGASRRWMATALTATFAVAVLAAELGRRGLVPAGLHHLAPDGHFRAIELAFYLLLAFEILGLVFGLASSVANAAGKQLEIFSLILMRQALEVFGTIHEPLEWRELGGRVGEMLADAAGALAMFVVIGVYYRVQHHQSLSRDLADRASFVASKKLLALGLLATFLALALRSLGGQLLGGPTPLFFEPFYTLLVFADVLLVLLSLRYSSDYLVVFRNSGLAVSTVLLRIALVAPPYAGAALGLAAALFALALSVAYNAFAPPAPAGQAAVTAPPGAPG